MIGRVNETESFLDAVQSGKSDDVAKLLDGNPSRERGHDRIAKLLPGPG